MLRCCDYYWCLGHLGLSANRIWILCCYRLTVATVYACGTLQRSCVVCHYRWVYSREISISYFFRANLGTHNMRWTRRNAKRRQHIPTLMTFATARDFFLFDRSPRQKIHSDSTVHLDLCVHSTATRWIVCNGRLWARFSGRTRPSSVVWQQQQQQLNCGMQSPIQCQHCMFERFKESICWKMRQQLQWNCNFHITNCNNTSSTTAILLNVTVVYT